MSCLNPAQSSKLAKDVYALTKMNSISNAIEFLNQEYGHVFSFANENMLKGRTGGPAFIKVRTAFGFALFGKGKLEGQAFIIFRGTQYLADWLTNLNIGASRSHSGQPVHDGFNTAFKSMEPQLKEFMSLLSKKSVHTIHCIGHSLGGALATICGDWIKSAYGIKPYIYSFGSPRVGLLGFAKCCTTNVGSERIFRAYHKTDIVPVIPPWPFIHTPTQGQDYFLWSPGSFPGAEYHDMKHYCNSVRGKSWEVLAGNSGAKKDDSGIERWLRQSQPVSFTLDAIEWLGQALVYVLKKCMRGIAWVISEAVCAQYTLLDQLSYALRKGVDLSENISSWVLLLIRKIMEVLGMHKVLKAADLTREFIRSTLINLQRKVNLYAQKALSESLAKGRAV